MIDAGPRHEGTTGASVASNDKTGPEDVEGSWSPRRPKSTSSKVTADKGPSTDPEVLAQEIEQTREELAETLDAIADKVSPKKVVGRTKKAAKDGANDAVEAVKGTAASAADSVKAGAAAVKEKVTGDSDPVRSPLEPASSVEVGSASALSDDTVSIPAAEVPVEPAPTPGALADAAYTVTEPAGGETPYVSTLPPPAPSRVPVFAGAGALLVLLYVMKRRRR
jgi:hypothetical protein